MVKNNALDDLNMTANDFIVAFYKLPVNNFYEMGLYSDASAINNLFNASQNGAFTEPNSLNLALPSFDTISPNPPIVNWITTGTNQTKITISLTFAAHESCKILIAITLSDIPVFTLSNDNIPSCKQD